MAVKFKSFCEYQYAILLVTASVTLLLEYIMGLIDRIIIANMLGEMAFAATNMIVPLFSLTMFIGTVIGAKTADWHAICMGRFKKIHADKVFSQGVILAVFSGIILFLLAVLGGNSFLQYLDMSQGMYRYASEYYHVYLFTVLITPIYILFLKLVYEERDILVYCSSFLVRIVSDVVLSMLLCSKFGISGVAWGTVLGDLLGFCVLLIHLKREGNSLRFVRYFNKKLARMMLFSGAPVASIYLYQVFFSVLMSKFFITYLGEQYLPALTVVLTVTGISSVLAAAGQAAEPLCFVYHGEKNKIKERQVMKLAGKTAVVLGLFASLSYLLGSHMVRNIFALTDPATIATVSIAIRIIAPSLVCASLVRLAATYYNIQENDLYTLLVNGLGEIVAPFIFAFPLGYYFGVKGVWIGFALASIVSLLLIIVHTWNLQSIKKRKRISEDEKCFPMYSYDIEITVENIMQLQTRVEQLLEKNNVNKRSIFNILLMIEEVLLLVREKNPGKRIYAECTIRIANDVQMILRDSGVIFDVTDADMPISSMRVFVLSSMMEYHKDKVHLVTTRFNRNGFRFTI